MTSRAVTLKAIDEALATKFAGMTINTGNPPASTPVPVFVEEPDPEEYPERVYPSVSITFLGMVPEYGGILDSDDDGDEETTYDAVAVPPESNRRTRPLPYRVQYSIDTWHRVRVSESRDLVTEAVLHRIKPRGAITIENIDGVDIAEWLFWSGGVGKADVRDIDEITYHKTLTVIVLAYLASVEADDTTAVKVATELDIEVQSRHTYLDSTGTLQVDDSKNVKDVEIRVTDTDVEVIP